MHPGPGDSVTDRTADPDAAPDLGQTEQCGNGLEVMGGGGVPIALRIEETCT